MPTHPRFSLAALTTVICWGLSFVASRIALDSLSPAALVASRLVIGLVTLAAIRRVLWPGRRLDSRDRGRCVLLGLILAGHLLMQNSGLLKTTATHAGWIVGFMPATIALGSMLFLRERLTRRAWLGIAIGAVGVTLVCLSTGLRFDDAKVGDLLQLISCFTWTAFTLLSVGPIGRSGALPVTVWVIGVAAGGAGLFELAGWTGWLGSADVWFVGPVTVPAVASVVFLGAICSGAAYVLWNVAIRSIGSPATSTYLYLEPFVTLIGAQVVLHEPLRGLGVAGGLVVLLGVWLVSSTRRALSVPATPPAPAKAGL